MNPASWNLLLNPAIRDEILLLVGPVALTALRALGVFAMAPLFNLQVVGWRVRLVLAIGLGLVAGSHGTLPTIESWPLAIAAELSLGVMIGLGLSLFVGGLRFTGELIDTAAGVGDATSDDAFDPSSPVETGPCVRLLSGLAVLLVVCSASPQGGMPLLESILNSYRRVPAGMAGAMWSQPQLLLAALQGAGEIALRTMLPVLCVVTLIGWGQGLLNRSYPQCGANAFAVSIRPIAAFFLLAATLSGATEIASTMMAQWVEYALH
jgi:type III secretory pathway component EscT